MKKRQFRKTFEQKYLKNSRYFVKPNKIVVVQAFDIYSNYFFNTAFDKGKLKSFVSWFLKKYGQKKTIDLLEDLKNLGFGYATIGGISLGIDDLKIPPSKADLLFRADLEIKSSNFRSKRAEITGVEQFQNLIDTWHQTSETLKQDVIKYFELTDIFNPVYMMAFSGARGNVSQVRQLVGMRGLMADPQGQIIDFPIRSNFREGLTLTEYIISTYGARKGIVDTALRTATAGYLTRRLVDVAQHVIVSQFDCGTMRGIFLFDMKEGLKTIYSFKDRLIGRVLAQDIYDNLKTNTQLNNTNTKIALRNQEISNDLASSIAKITKKALVRSPLTCETRRLVCQLCYGWSLSKGSLVSLGEAVGVIAAQSIGEPGTQLTMRTFHTGGVFSGGITDQIIAPNTGIVYYSNPIPGTCIRTPQGEIAFLTKVEGSFLFKTNSHTNLPSFEQIYKIPAYTILFVRHEQKVTKKQILAQFSALSKQQAIQADAEQVIYSKFEGQVYFSHLDLIEQSHEKYGDIRWKTEDWAKIWILSGKVYENPVLSYFFPNQGDFITKKSLMNQIEWYIPESGFVEINSLPTQSDSLKQSVSVYSRNDIFFNSDKIFFKKNSIQISKKFFKTLKTLKDKMKSCVKVKNQKFIFDLISSGNVYILSKRLIRSNCSKSYVLINTKSGFKKNSISLKNNKYNLDFYNPKINVSNSNIKFAKLKMPFYYPFQKVSFKRLIAFLSYGAQKEIIIQKKMLKFKQLFSDSKFKKITSKNKLSIFELQKKWQPWLKMNHIPKIIRKKTIQYKLQNQESIEWPNKTISKKTTNRIYRINLLQHLNKSLRNNSVLVTDQGNSEKIMAEKKSKLFANSKNKLFFNFTKLKPDFFRIDNPAMLQMHVNKKITETKLLNLKKKQLIDILKRKKSLQITNFPLEKSSNILLKTPLLEFSLNSLNYKKITYSLSFNKTKTSLHPVVNSLSLMSNQKNQFHSDFQIKNKVDFLTFFPLNESFLTNNIKLTNLNPKSSFSTHVALNQKTLTLQNLEVKNTFSWSNFPNKLLSWFPDEYQTINNGIFLLSGLVTDDPNSNKNFSQYLFFLQKNRKSLKTFQTKQIFSMKILFSLNVPKLIYLRKFENNFKIFTQENSKTNNSNLTTMNRFLQFKNSKHHRKISYQIFNFKISEQASQKLSFPDFNEKFFPQKIQKLDPLNKTIVSFLSSLTKIRTKNNCSLKIKHSIKDHTAISKTSTVEFFKIKLRHSTLRWNNKKFIENFDIQKLKNYTSLKIFKSNVNFTELFWLPEETYEIVDQSFRKEKSVYDESSLLLENNEKTNQTQNSYFMESKQPLCFVLNRQGLKTVIFSNLEGFISISSKPVKIKKTTKSLITQNYLMTSNIEYLKMTNSLINKNFDFEKLNVHQKIFATSGPAGLESINHILKNHLNFAVLKAHKKRFKRIKIQNVFKKKVQKKSQIETFSFFSQNLHSLNVFNNFENEEKNCLGLFPIKKLFISNFSENQNILKNFSKISNSALKITKKQITIKQGWVYVINDFSKINYLHQSIIEPGVQFLKNLSFDHYRLFLELLPIPFDSTLTTQTQLELNQSFRITKKVFNQNSRFFEHSVSEFTQPKFLILIRPMQYKVINNPETFKRKISKFTKKISFSLLKLKTFSSSLTNQQESAVKLISSFPAPDILVTSKLKLPQAKFNHLKNNEKLLKLQKQSKVAPIFLDFLGNSKPVHLKQKIEISNQNKILNLRILKNQFFSVKKSHFYGSVFEHSYYSLQAINFNPLFIRGSIPPSQFYLFKIPLVKFNTSKTVNFNFLSSQIGNTSKLLNFLNFKSLYSKQSKENQQNSLTLTHVNTLQKFLLNLEIMTNNQNNKPDFFQLLKIQSLTFDFLIPVVEWVYSEKMNYFYNQRFFDYETDHKNLNPTNSIQNNYFKQQIFKPVSHLIPKIQNKYFVYPTTQRLKNQPLGKTGFISPVEGEIITKESFIYNSKTHHLSASTEKRTRDQLILTKLDMVSIRFFDLKPKNKFQKLNFSDLHSRKPLISKNLKFFPGIKQKYLIELYKKILSLTTSFQIIDQQFEKFNKLEQFELKNFSLKYQQKIYKINGLKIGQQKNYKELRLGKFLISGDPLYLNFGIAKSGQIIHLNIRELTIRTGEYLSVSPNAILHSYNGNFIKKNTPVMTLPFQTLKTGDIVQGIPKIEQYLEARTTQQGRLFVRSLPVLMQAIFERYCTILSHDKAVRQSLLKIQQILVDGVQRVYRSQGISIADKHLEIIVKQMTSKVQIIFGGQTGLFPGELVDLEFVERLNRRVLIKIYYEPIVLGITRASLEVDSFLSAASFQQTTKILAKAAIYKQKDYLKGLKENLLIGNLIPAGTGYIMVSKS